MCDAVKGVPGDCVAITDNTNKANYGLRMGQLTIQKPDALTAAKSAVVASILADAVTMNLVDCNLLGTGNLSWLLQFDLPTGKLKTGGALPAADPTAGYCFINKALGGKPVAPVTLDAKPDASGKFSVAKGGDMILPLFLNGAAEWLLLPLSQTRLLNSTLSADQNCIGTYNSALLDPADSCQPSGNVLAFTSGGSADAFITLENADGVPIGPLNETLCVLLTGENDGGSPKKCKRNASGQITSKGDWCALTNMAASPACADAFQFKADYAASAVTITGDCP